MYDLKGDEEGLPRYSVLAEGEREGGSPCVSEIGGSTQEEG